MDEHPQRSFAFSSYVLPIPKDKQKLPLSRKSCEPGRATNHRGRACAGGITPTGRRRRTRQGHKGLRMCRFRVSISPITGIDLLFPSRNICTLQCPLEKRQGSFGLVIWNLVACLIDPREAEVSILSDFAVLGTVDGKGNVAGLGKVSRLCEF